jgi:diguanylate cyclase
MSRNLSQTADAPSAADRVRRQPFSTGPLLIGLAHFIVALATIEFTHLSTGLATVWGANALALAALLVVPAARWLPYLAAVAAGGLLANWIGGYPPAASAAFALINAGEITLAAWITLRWVGTAPELERPADLAKFVVAALAASAASAAFGGPVMHVTTGQSLGSSWFSWFASDTLGLLIVTPVLLIAFAIWSGRRSFLEGRSVAEAAALFTMVAGFSVLVFAQNDWPLLFLLLPPVVLATFRLRSAGATVAIVIIGVTGSWFTTLGNGPIMLIDGDLPLRIYFFQFFLAVAFLPALPVASVLDERDALAAIAERQAATDDLTGTASRRAFMARLFRDAPGATGTTPLAVALFDVDYFKAVNDRFGHDVGDEVLRRVGREAMQCVGDGGFVGRLGGEEFAVLMPGIGMPEATAICERLRRACADPARFSDGAVPVTISVGVALAVPGAYAGDALKAADEAMYRAKTGGRDRVVVAD